MKANEYPYISHPDWKLTTPAETYLTDGTDADTDMVHVLGLGAVGGVWTHQLVARGVPVLALSAGMGPPVTISVSQSRPVHVPVVGTESLSDRSIETLLVTTKAFDVLPALRSVKRALRPGATVVLLSNGMGFQESAAAMVEEMQATLVIASTTMGCFVRHKDAGSLEIQVNGLGETVVGPWRDQQWTADRVGFLTSVQGHTEFKVLKNRKETFRLLLRKLCVNACINPASVLFNCENGQLLNNDFWLNTLVPSVAKEVAAITPVIHQGVVLPEDELVDAAFHVAKNTFRNKSSMLMDVLNRRATEIDFMNGFVVKTAIQHGLPCVANERLLRLVKGIEANKF